MDELVFQVTQEEDDGFCTRAVGESIFTQRDTWDESREVVLDATSGLLLRLNPARTHPPAPSPR